MTPAPVIYDAEAEAIVLGTMFGPMVNRSHVAECLEMLDVQDFKDLQNRQIFKAIKAAFLAGEPLDHGHTILHRLRRAGIEETAGGALKLHDLLHHAPTTEIARHHLKVVKWAARLDEWRALKSQDMTNDEEMQKVVESALVLLGELRSGETKLPSPLAAEITGAFDLLEEDARRRIGFGSGIAKLDEVTGGFMSGQFVVVGARTSVGKTSFLTQIATEAARQGGRVLFVSLEMPNRQVTHRIMAQSASVPVQQMTNPATLTDDSWTKLSTAAGHAPQGLYLTDGSFTIDNLSAKVRRFIGQYGNLDMVCVDYIQLLKGMRKGTQNRTEEVGEVSRALKAMANDLGICVIAASQLSRQHEHDKRMPQPRDLRESGSLEHDCDVLIFLHRPELEKGETQLANNIETTLYVAKNRNGAVGTTTVYFNAPLNRFEAA